MNLDHDFVQVWKFSEDQKKKANGALFSPNSGEDQKKGLQQEQNTFFSQIYAQLYIHSNYWGDADVDHSQTIGGETAKLLGGCIPPGFGTHASENFLFEVPGVQKYITTLLFGSTTSFHRLKKKVIIVFK